MQKPKRQRVKLGDVVAIPLTDGAYAFGREFVSGLGVYDYIGGSASDIPREIRRFLFIVPVRTCDLSSGAWPKVGRDSDLPTDAVGWPFSFIRDLFNGKFELYDHVTGNVIPSSEDEWRGLECLAVWSAEHVIERIQSHRAGTVSDCLGHCPWVPDVVEVAPDGQAIWPAR